MMKKLLGGVLLGTLAACSTQQDIAGQTPRETWTNVKPVAMSTIAKEVNQGLVVFYRQGDTNPSTFSIYVDGDYQTSLFDNSYSEVSVCASSHLLSASLYNNQGFGNRTQGTQLSVSPNQVSYVKVQPKGNGKFVFVGVEPQIAEQEIAQLPRTSHTLSRVNAQNCGAPVIANKTLDASALFKFAQSSYASIQPKGHEEIQAFAESIKTNNEATSIEVAGYTDPVGSAKVNQALSQKRANTVKLALQKGGVTLPIKAVGYGATNLVVTNCDGLKGAKRNQCNQPNRRVVISVYGK